MSFSDIQLRQLKAPIRTRHIKEREIDGKLLHYLEGWHLIAEANRIFGFDAWDRETISSQCVWQKQADQRFSAAYLTRVRITVRAGDRTIYREGLGSGEAQAASAGQAHERASKAAETDATKRALSTFGNSFGLSLYKDKSESTKAKRTRPRSDTTIKSAVIETPNSPAPQAINSHMVEASLPVWLPHRPEPETSPVAKIDKSVLTLAEPKRRRDRDHLRYVASQPCLVCARLPSQAHHLRFAQPRALGRKVSDEYTVPLCATHHSDLHFRGNETEWWKSKNIDPIPIAESLWAGQEEAS